MSFTRMRVVLKDVSWKGVAVAVVVVVVAGKKQTTNKSGKKK